MTLHFQREIERLKTNLLSLSALVEDTLHRAITALRERDGALARIIIDNDPEIDLLEVDIEEECQKILALHQPVAHDLRFLIACLKINAELERIGDAAVNIAERVVFLVGQEPISVPFDYLGMAEKAQLMLHKSLDALVNLNVELAYQVIEADDEVDADNRQAYVQIENCIQQDPRLTCTYTHLLGISRHIERIADHATNIAEDVVYLIEGTIIRHRTEEYRPTPEK
jgi:phosphate transport system protein